jgi:hypothetical protein
MTINFRIFHSTNVFNSMRFGPYCGPKPYTTPAYNPKFSNDRRRKCDVYRRMVLTARKGGRCGIFTYIHTSREKGAVPKLQRISITCMKKRSPHILNTARSYFLRLSPLCDTFKRNNTYNCRKHLGVYYGQDRKSLLGHFYRPDT